MAGSATRQSLAWYPFAFMKETPQFGLAQKAYSAYRPQYPPQLFERILAALGDGRRKRAVDLGSGTGLSVIPLAAHFSEVAAVERDEKMASQIPREKISVHIQPAEEHREAPGSVDLVTSGTAFYWMDGPQVAALAAEWLRLGGVFAVYGGGLPVAPPPVEAVVQREMAERWDAHRHPRLREEKYSERTIRACPALAVLSVERVLNDVNLTAEAYAGFWSSTSYCSAYMRMLPDGAAYVQKLATEFSEAAGGKAFTVDFGVELILARKNG